MRYTFFLPSINPMQIIIEMDLRFLQPGTTRKTEYKWIDTEFPVLLPTKIIFFTCYQFMIRLG
jgi:hypothetical protein